MNIKNTCFSAILGTSLFFSQSSFADITQGVVIPGESLPIGISVGDTRAEVESVLATMPEFDLNDPNNTFCDVRNTCFYFAEISADNSEILKISYLGDTATRLTWTFGDWTVNGVSLNDIAEETFTESDLVAAFPSARLARIVDFRGVRRVILSSPNEGISIGDDSLLGTLTGTIQ
ncbi:hypothetical protein [Agarilytica rhodophyticola]|uniref:hypothetical protein n=1 Tax=Agarilytica rhodophyticola TaxID=1737490 RepID=UPI000B3428D8|nr:hypothetical protein [Agarilytica rhodophyticola]